MTESYKLIKSNGDELEFNNDTYYLNRLGGLGNPDIDYTTQKTFFQDGSIVTNFVVSPRQLNFPIITDNENIDKRTDFWDLRNEILSFLSPVSGAMSFQITTDDHITYELVNVFPTNGLTMEGNTFSDSRNDGRIDENLRLTAFDPIWRISPINTTGQLTPVESQNLIFPFEFPILFGSGGGEVDQTISYQGTWRSYPKITIDGPYNTATITNKQNSVSISLVRPITVGEQRIIDLLSPTEGFSITDASGNNKIGEINLNTNLTQFFFVPDATNGIDAVFNGGDANTRVTVEWYTKLLGI
jgi:hypothetical protein